SGLTQILSDNGKILISVQVKRENNRFRISDSPFELTELCSVLGKLDLDARPVWFKTGLSPETIRLRGILPKELYIECRRGKSSFPPLTARRTEEIARSFAENGHYSTAIQWLDGSDSSVKDIISGINDGASLKKLSAEFERSSKEFNAVLERCEVLRDKESLLLLAEQEIHPDRLKKLLAEANSLSPDPERTAEILTLSGSGIPPEELFGDDPRSLFFVSDVYSRMQNSEKALEWMRLSAAGGCEDAKIRLISEFPSEKSFETCKSLAENGNAECMNLLGKMYRDGIGTGTDLELAGYWFFKASESGIEESESYLKSKILGAEPKSLVRRLLNESGPEYAEELCRKLSREGSPEMLGYLGSAYRTGSGTGKDLDKAIGLLRESSDLGSSLGESELMKALSELSTRSSLTEMIARAWRSARNGDAGAENVIGNAYLTGKGVSIDKNKADEWLKKSAEDSDTGSGDYYGRLWRAGTKDSLAELFRLVENNDTPKGHLYKARLFRSGIAGGTPESALDEYRKASDGGPAWIQNEYLDHLRRLNTPDSWNELARKSRIYANSGNPGASLHLGRCCRLGKGTGKN
ncbi:MAG: sel1 repeat family protein, partial [Candidatus Methanomethylophilaceae archaeon]|nr:sel1 repeat family protein [Candidatus Methanomethylophilaceae archaeon]